MMTIKVGYIPGQIPVIQDAIDIDTELICVSVGPGQYDEEIIINKSHVEIFGESMFSRINGDIHINIENEILSDFPYIFVLRNIDFRGVLTVKNFPKKGSILIRNCQFDSRKIHIPEGVRLLIEKCSTSRIKIIPVKNV